MVLFNKNNYTISYNATFLEVLNVINLNNRRFAVICDNEKVVGLVTDGDVRRSLLSGCKLNDQVQFNKNFIFVNYSDEFEFISQKFRDFNLDFLLVLKEGALYNIINKNQFHIMLLEDIKFRTDADFTLFDRNLVHEIFNRPWGFYKSVMLTKHAQAKVLTIFPLSETSLQFHMHREEHWVVIKGSGEIICNKDRYEVKPGQYVHVPKQCEHQIINMSVEENLVISEVQLGEYFGEDDIIRIQDKYGRI